MKLTLAVFVSFLAYNAFAQEILFDKSIALKRGDRDAYPVVNDSTGNLTMFLFDKNTIYGLSFDKEYNVVNELEGPRAEPSNTYDHILGCGISKGIYSIFFSSSNHKNFATTTFDFENKKVTSKVIKFPFKKGESYVGSINHRGTFYLFTTMEPDKIKVYSLDNPDQFKFREHSFPNHKFTVIPYAKLYDILEDDQALSIDNETHNPIDVTSSKNKLYAYGNKVVLTIDNYEFYTSVIEFDANTLESKLRVIKQPSIYCGDYKLKKINSYIYNQKLYQLKVCGQELAVSIFDLEKDTIMNKLMIKRTDDEFTFNNTPVIQKGGYYDDERELGKTKQFLRKLMASEIGITAISTSTGIEVTLGGRREINQPGGGGGMMPGIPMSSPFGSFLIPPVFNPTAYGYSAYKFSLSVYFKTLISPETYQHQVGEVKENVFDKIQKFTEDFDKKISALTVFKMDGVHIVGYYFKPEEKYYLRKFE